MRNTEVQNITRLMQNVFNGSAWHGPSVLKILEEVGEDDAFRKFENIHTIAELVVHMTAWKKFALERVSGNQRYEVSEQEEWKEITSGDRKDWNNIKSNLTTIHNELIGSLSKITDQKLSELVENKAYDFYTLLHGVIQHDIYHAGQISLLKKQ